MATSKNCIFCAIIAKEVPAIIVKETNNLVVIQDRVPKAPIHYLIIPKQHFDDIRQLPETDVQLAGKMLLMAKELSNTLPQPNAFRLIANNGAEVGQSVFHAHLHFLAGKKYTDF